MNFTGTERYVATDDLRMAVNAAVNLERPLLIKGEPGTGKTMLAEAMLFKAGAIQTLGEITRGTTVCDFDPQEKEHQHSLGTAIASLDHNGRHVNLLDTPGYPDFLGRALIALPAVETVAVVVDARSGIEPSNSVGLRPKFRL